jgi:hypothetical protein
MEDYGLQLEGLLRNFGQQKGAQEQAANAAGVYDAGTLAAAAQKRKANLSFARQPIDIGARRLQEDVGTALQRSRTSERRLRADTHLNIRRLRRDTRHDRRLTRRDFRRTRLGIYNTVSRARREQTIGNAGLLTQEIFDARQRKPGTFDRQGRRT